MDRIRKTLRWVIGRPQRFNRAAEATMFFNTQTQDRATFTRSLSSVKGSTASRSAQMENRVPDLKTGGAIFILAVL
jgi:hypothetical protein